MTAEQERDAVVRWLRAEAKRQDDLAANPRFYGVDWAFLARERRNSASTFRQAADAIKRGDHHKDTGS